MPGTPIIYYGDEIGMGDNIYLGDRNGVRTPMQWNGDRNAGFSRADPQALYLPLVIDPVYHYQAINVEAQRRVAELAPELDAAADRHPQALPGLRPRHASSSCIPRTWPCWPTSAATRTRRILVVNASRASADATRRSQVSASSSPPPIACPLRAATDGNG